MIICVLCSSEVAGCCRLQSFLVKSPNPFFSNLRTHTCNTFIVSTEWYNNMSKHALVINNIVGRNIWYTWDFTPLLNIALCCRVSLIYCVVYSFFFLPLGSQWWHYLILFVFSPYNISWYIDSVMISMKRPFSVFIMHFTCVCSLDYLCCAISLF